MKNSMCTFIKYGTWLLVVMLTVSLNAQQECERKLESWNQSSFPEGKVQDYENCVKDLEESTRNVETEIKKLISELESKQNQINILKKSYDQLIKYWDSEDNGEKVDGYRIRKKKIENIKTK